VLKGWGRGGVSGAGWVERRISPFLSRSGHFETETEESRASGLGFCLTEVTIKKLLSLKLRILCMDLLRKREKQKNWYWKSSGNAGQRSLRWAFLFSTSIGKEEYLGRRREESTKNTVMTVSGRRARRRRGGGLLLGPTGANVEERS